MLALIESPEELSNYQRFFLAEEGKNWKGEKGEGGKTANPIPCSNPTIVMAEGGEKTQPRPERKASVAPGAFLRLIKDIRGRLTRYFSPPSANRGAQPPPTTISQEVDEGIFVL